MIARLYSWDGGIGPAGACSQQLIHGLAAAVISRSSSTMEINSPEVNAAAPGKPTASLEIFSLPKVTAKRRSGEGEKKKREKLIQTEQLYEKTTK